MGCIIYEVAALTFWVEHVVEWLSPVQRYRQTISLAEKQLPKIGGTAKLGWGHDSPPMGGYRATWGSWLHGIFRCQPLVSILSYTSINLSCATIFVELNCLPFSLQVPAHFERSVYIINTEYRCLGSICLLSVRYSSWSIEPEWRIKIVGR
jgi:hypothetical protein